MLDLPGDDARMAPVALHDPGAERLRRREQLRVVGRPDEPAFRERVCQAMLRHEEFWVAERLQRSDAEDDLFPRSLGGVHLPIELASVEDTVAGLDPVPVRAEADDLKRTVQQVTQGRTRIQPQRLDLSGTKADPEPR